MPCQSSRHKEHVKNFVKKYPTAKGKVPDTMITVNPEDWVIDLEDPKKNTVQCCQMCSIQEDIKRVTSLEWKDQPANYNPYEWKMRYY